MEAIGQLTGGIAHDFTSVTIILRTPAGREGVPSGQAVPADLRDVMSAALRGRGW